MRGDACRRCQRLVALELVARTLVSVWDEVKARREGETVPAPVAASLERLERLLREPPH
jgi:hypothetical protein